MLNTYIRCIQYCNRTLFFIKSSFENYSFYAQNTIRNVKNYPVLNTIKVILYGYTNAVISINKYFFE